MVFTGQLPHFANLPALSLPYTLRLDFARVFTVNSAACPAGPATHTQMGAARLARVFPSCQTGTLPNRTRMAWVLAAKCQATPTNHGLPRRMCRCCLASSMTENNHGGASGQKKCPPPRMGTNRMWEQPGENHRPSLGADWPEKLKPAPGVEARRQQTEYGKTGRFPVQSPPQGGCSAVAARQAGCSG